MTPHRDAGAVLVFAKRRVGVHVLQQDASLRPNFGAEEILIVLPVEVRLLPPIARCRDLRDQYRFGSAKGAHTFPRLPTATNSRTLKKLLASRVLSRALPDQRIIDRQQVLG